MGLSPATALFLALTVLWIGLPFVPGWREIRGRRDVHPLRVTRASQVDIRHFAHRFRAFLLERCRAALESARAGGGAREGTLVDGTRFMVVPSGGRPALDPAERDRCERLLMSPGDLDLPDGFVHTTEVYAGGDLRAGEGSVYRAALADGDLRLGADSASLRWLHAGGGLTAGPRCFLGGRASADGRLTLAPGCRFERLSAPEIAFGEGKDGAAGPHPPPAPPPPDPEREALQPERVPHLCDRRGGRWLVAGNLDLGPGRLIRADLVVLGRAVLRRGSRLEGSLKSRGRLVLEAGATVTGAVVGEGDLVVGEGALVAGPVAAEGTVLLQRGAVVGAPATPTTVLAGTILVEPGTRCHGTVRAHRRGDVLAPAEGGAA